MKKLIKLLNDFSLLFDIVNAILGIILVILIILIFRNPLNKAAMTAAFTVGGSMNIINGVKYYKDSKKKSMAMTFLLLGIIIIFIGFAVIK